MTHPFEKMLYKELQKSTPGNNLVLKKAEAIREKGYRSEEIYQVLKHLHDGLVKDSDRKIVLEALEEIEKYTA